MIAFLASWRDMGWQAALLFLFGFFAIVAMLGVWLCLRFGRDEFGVYIEPKDARRPSNFSVGRDVKKL